MVILLGAVALLIGYTAQQVARAQEVKNAIDTRELQHDAKVPGNKPAAQGLSEVTDRLRPTGISRMPSRKHRYKAGVLRSSHSPMKSAPAGGGTFGV